MRPTERPARQRRREVAQRAELDVADTRDMTGPELRGLAHVDRAGRVESGGVDVEDRGDRSASGLPGAHPAGQLASQVLVADVEGLAHHFRPVLVVVEHEHLGTGRVGEPAEPGGEHRAQRYRQRAGDVPGGVGGDRTGIDQLSAVSHEAADPL
jgi:hypothetical protein